MSGSRLSVVANGTRETGAVGVAGVLRSSIAAARAPAGDFRLAALGRVDTLLRQSAAVLREAAAEIDDDPVADASALAMRARLVAESVATAVLDVTGRSLGAGPFCKNLRFAKLAADLPVYLRQSHAEHDFAALGERMTAGAAWMP